MSGEYSTISSSMRYRRVGHCKASVGQETKLSLCRPRAVTLEDFISEFVIKLSHKQLVTLRQNIPLQNAQ